MAEAATEVFNYYSSGDDVFKEFPTVPSRLDGLDESLEMYCWQKQETLKCSRLPAGTAYGGWRFHMWTTTVWNDREQRWDGAVTNYTPAAATAMVADGTVTNNPVFNRGFSPMFDRNAPLDDQWLAVAKYVPAVSSPVGGKIVLGRNRDFDLNSDNYPLSCRYGMTVNLNDYRQIVARSDANGVVAVKFDLVSTDFRYWLTADGYYGCPTRNVHYKMKKDYLYYVTLSEHEKEESVVMRKIRNPISMCRPMTGRQDGVMAICGRIQTEGCCLFFQF